MAIDEAVFELVKRMEGGKMLRAFFMAIAITLAILGAECMVLEKAVLAKQVMPAAVDQYAYWDDPSADPLDLPSGSRLVHKTVSPPEWAPWSLLSAGVVMMLYSITMRRGGGGGE